MLMWNTFQPYLLYQAQLICARIKLYYRYILMLLVILLIAAYVSNNEESWCRTKCEVIITSSYLYYSQLSFYNCLISFFAALTKPCIWFYRICCCLIPRCFDTFLVQFYKLQFVHQTASHLRTSYLLNQVIHSLWLLGA